MRIIIALFFLFAICADETATRINWGDVHLAPKKNELIIYTRIDTVGNYYIPVMDTIVGNDQH